jgi:hypothetical protein
MRKVVLLTGLLVLFGAIASAAGRQAGDSVTGKYEGVAKSDAFGDIPISADIKHESGKLTGKIDSAQGPAPITAGTFAEGKVTLKLDAGGNELVINGELKGDKIVGTWEMAGQKGTFELKKVTLAATAQPSKPAAPIAAGDPVSGDWEASAEAQGQTIPFTLKLKLEGEKITGSTESPQGVMPIAKGSFTAGKLNISLDTPNGTIVLTGLIKEGKIDGEFDFAGQAQGKWSAKKK